MSLLCLGQRQKVEIIHSINNVHFIYDVTVSIDSNIQPTFG